MVRFLRALPRKPAILMTRAMGRAAYYVAIKDRRRTFRHLFIAFGKEKSRSEIIHLARWVFLHFGTTAADAVRIPKLVRAGLDGLITVEGRKYLDNALTPRRGFITITAIIVTIWWGLNDFLFKIYIILLKMIPGAINEDINK